MNLLQQTAARAHRRASLPNPEHAGSPTTAPYRQSARIAAGDAPAPTANCTGADRGNSRAIPDLRRRPTPAGRSFRSDRAAKRYLVRSPVKASAVTAALQAAFEYPIRADRFLAE